ncbi:MAG TPA: DUF2846 domain-containing protein [Lacunisphaera sp.]|jgi:hypothetical protein|nr:DUF2846 domain-containing protein [Lacunisphaera sp.]
MKKMTCLVLIGIGLALLQGCASGPASSEVKGTVPALAAGKGRIYFYRTSMTALDAQPVVKFDGQEVGKAAAGGFFYVDAPAGDHKIVTGTAPDQQLTIQVEPGQTRYVRLLITLKFTVAHIDPELADNAAGEKEMAGCKLINS